MTDQELIDQIQSGSQSAFRHLVDKYQVLVFNTCIGFVGNRQSAEDLSQDVFIETYRSISKFRGEAKLSTWLYRISVNKSLNHIRDHKKHNVVRSLERFFMVKRKRSWRLKIIFMDRLICLWNSNSMHVSCTKQLIACRIINR